MIDFFKRLFRRMGRSTPSSSDDYLAVARSPEFIKNMVKAVGYTREMEYSCDEVLEIIDQYAEMAARGEDAAQMMPLIMHHLEMCADCNEEYEALMRVLKAMPA